MICELEFRLRDGTIVGQRHLVVGGARDAELFVTGPDIAKLRELAKIGRGPYNPSSDQIASLVSTPILKSEPRVHETWRWCLILALLLWPIDVAIRRFG